jgi:hypothetical protein
MSLKLTPLAWSFKYDIISNASSGLPPSNNTISPYMSPKPSGTFTVDCSPLTFCFFLGYFVVFSVGALSFVTVDFTN